uniref:Uncharacterized protein n=1 Tax=Nelumbo nucifera TaxID=4432 RepID=A0A822ZSA0_NELNU|nr:TPA_asm: hypothetical protein HUJ06_017307 [Nelumbo nucifera]
MVKMKNIYPPVVVVASVVAAVSFEKTVDCGIRGKGRRNNIKYRGRERGVESLCTPRLPVDSGLKEAGRVRERKKGAASVAATSFFQKKQVVESGEEGRRNKIKWGEREFRSPMNN